MIQVLLIVACLYILIHLIILIFTNTRILSIILNKSVFYQILRSIWNKYSLHLKNLKLIIITFENTNK